MQSVTWQSSSFVFANSNITSTPSPFVRQKDGVRVQPDFHLGSFHQNLHISRVRYNFTFSGCFHQRTPFTLARVNACVKQQDQAIIKKKEKAIRG